jgi:hypothetical protein
LSSPRARSGRAAGRRGRDGAAEEQRDPAAVRLRLRLRLRLTDGSSGTQTIGGGSATVTSAGTYRPLYSGRQRLAGTNTTVTYNDGSDQASAVSAARAANVAIVFASDNYGHEEADNT